MNTVQLIERHFVADLYCISAMVGAWELAHSTPFTHDDQREKRACLVQMKHALELEGFIVEIADDHEGAGDRERD